MKGFKFFKEPLLCTAKHYVSSTSYRTTNDRNISSDGLDSEFCLNSLLNFDFQGATPQSGSGLLLADAILEKNCNVAGNQLNNITKTFVPYVAYADDVQAFMNNVYQ